MKASRLFAWLMLLGVVAIVATSDWLDPNWRYQVSNGVLTWIVIGILGGIIAFVWFGLKQVPRLSLFAAVTLTAVGFCVLGGAIGGAYWLITRRSEPPVSKTAQPPIEQLSVEVRAMGLIASVNSQQNQIYIQGSLELTNTSSDGVSVEVWMRVISNGKAPVYIRADFAPHPKMPPAPFITGPEKFLGHIVNVPGRSTEAGVVAYTIFERGDSGLQALFGAEDLQWFLMMVPKQLELRDRVSGLARQYDVY